MNSRVLSFGLLFLVLASLLWLVIQGSMMIQKKDVERSEFKTYFVLSIVLVSLFLTATVVLITLNYVSPCNIKLEKSNKALKGMLDIKGVKEALKEHQRVNTSLSGLSDLLSSSEMRSL